jgi:hypothetical protein
MVIPRKPPARLTQNLRDQTYGLKLTAGQSPTRHSRYDDGARFLRLSILKETRWAFRKTDVPIFMTVDPGAPTRPFCAGTLSVYNPTEEGSR